MVAVSKRSNTGVRALYPETVEGSRQGLIEASEKLLILTSAKASGPKEEKERQSHSRPNEAEAREIWRRIKGKGREDKVV